MSYLNQICCYSDVDLLFWCVNVGEGGSGREAERGGEDRGRENERERERKKERERKEGRERGRKEGREIQRGGGRKVEGREQKLQGKEWVRERYDGRLMLLYNSG